MLYIDNINSVPAGYGDEGYGTPPTNMFSDLMPTGGGGGSAFGGYAPPPSPAPTPAPAPTPTPAPAPGAPAPSALDAWQTFYNSPAYQVPLAEGLKGVNTKYAAMGALESGAAMKAIDDYAAGHAASALGTYMDDLYRQEALGEAASSSLAGVGQNLVTQVSANNNNAADANANAALYGGQASANNWNNVGSAVGTAAGSIAGAQGSSYSPSPTGGATYGDFMPGIPDPLYAGIG